MNNYWLVCNDHDHTKPFGQKKLPMHLIEDKIDKESIRIMKRRVLCKECFEYKSVSGSCSC